ncbi:MAG: class I SAM-dependent methyltransferase [Kiritimatiellae bacterium]|nr:class I SAM-dependent methyltransferase [Kiritimatiellia bacterium]
MNCRHCGTLLRHVFLDLGFAPPSNAYLAASDLARPEKHYPLKVFVCHNCFLVQTADFADRETFFNADYAYFSSTSASWLKHAEIYFGQMVERLALTQNSFVVEIASNDGYLLKNAVARGIPCLGIEPTSGTAAAALKQNVPTFEAFFGEALARTLAKEGTRADLIIGNNVYAHVPDINDFTAGLTRLLKPAGTITLEFPHLLNLIRHAQFDTVYHEHYSYLSLNTVKRIFETHGLRVYDVEEIPTHGGSLRVYGCHAESGTPVSPHVHGVLKAENDAGLLEPDSYLTFQARADSIKNAFVTFLLDAKRCQKRVVAYGAAAKGNTLLNYAGIRPDLLPAVFDAAPSKQGKYLPGSHIPILHPEQLALFKPDYVVILPWNLKSELVEQNNRIRLWGGRFVTAIPELEVF